MAVVVTANKSLVSRFLDEIYNKGNYDSADTVVATDYISHNELSIEVLGPRRNQAGCSRAAHGLPGPRYFDRRLDR